MSQSLALIVDDHGDSAIIFSEAMRIAGFAVEIARTGDEALRRLADATPDVVVLDLCLPRVAGTEILQHIRDDRRLADTYVIVVSADPVLASTNLDQADQVLVKPIGFKWLRDLAIELSNRFSSRGGNNNAENGFTK
jgi:CheY-like chemotaxis protein